MLKRNVEKEKFNKILRLIKKDAEKGLECFYNEYGKMIYLTAKSSGCSHEKANVVVNSVLIKIWKKASQIKDIENPKAWVYTVAKNCAKDELGEVWHLELKEEICGTDYEPWHAHGDSVRLHQHFHAVCECHDQLHRRGGFCDLRCGLQD